MYALVNFYGEKAKDGSTACEIVPMMWITHDLTSCKWPGNSYHKEFKKKNSVPGPTWKSWPCKVKFMSADLDFLREKRDNYLMESTGNDESEHESRKNQLENSGSKLDSSPCSSSDESSSEGYSPKLKRNKVTLPQAPVFVPTLEILNFGSTTGNSGENQPLVVDFIEALPSSQQKENDPIILSTNAEVSGSQVTKDADFQKLIIRRLEKIERKIGEVQQDLKRISQSQPNRFEFPANCPVLPVISVPNLDAFEAYISSPEELHLMADFLSRTGGKNEEEATKRVLAEIFADALAAKLNWKGIVKKNNIPKIGVIKYGNVVKLLKCAVRKVVPAATDKTIEETAKYWLKTAPGRDTAN